MVAPNFYNLADQNIYNQGYSFIPQEMYRGGAFNIPTNNNTGGVTTLPVNPFMNSGGGGGGGTAFTGGVNSLTTDFMNTITDRQNRLNNPSDKFFGFDTMRDQQLTGADAGFYIGSNTAIPQEKTFAGNIQDFLTPQSADDIIAGGYEPKMKLGILANILPDRYGTLPRGDQAFIARNMGYTGPTVFGENTGNQDIFGMNTRSGFGNYAEAVGKQVDKLGASLGAGGAIGGKDAYQGATFNEETGMFEADDDTAAAMAAAAKANQMTKMVRAKYNFYTQQTKQRDDDRKAAEEAQAKQTAAIAAANKAAAARGDRRGGYQSNFAQDSDFMGGGGRDRGNDPSDAGGSDTMGSFAYGGRVPYMMGGLANLVDIYD